MAAENEPKTGTNTHYKGKKRKQFLPHNRPVKKKGAYPLRPGIQGFFITCDGGRERQASNEALYVIDSFYDELVNEKCSSKNLAGVPTKPLNKKIVFASSSSDDDEDENSGEDEEVVVGEENEGGEGGKGEGEQSDTSKGDDENQENLANEKSVPHDPDDVCCGDEIKGMAGENKDDVKSPVCQANEAEEPPAKKQCLKADASTGVTNNKVVEKSIDKLIEAELKEIGDKNKRRFINLDSGCNGVAIVQMRKRDGDPSPKDIVQHMMTSAKSTRKPVSRFILRVLPVELACYASEEEISKAIKPLVAQYFPEETQDPLKFAVLYEARANTGIDRMKIINVVAKSVPAPHKVDLSNPDKTIVVEVVKLIHAQLIKIINVVAKSVPAPHKVDLSNPDKTIVVEVVKTVCMIGVVEKYKELSKYNLRQLTSPKQ